MNLRERFLAVRERIAAACAAANRAAGEVELIAVSKTHPADSVREALACGQVAFGENRIQELAPKARELAATPARWHMIGSVQTNKVRELLAIEQLVLVHSLDREKLADALQARLAVAPALRSLRCLIEVNASGDPNKHGTAPSAAAGLLAHVERNCPNLVVDGLMAMAPLGDDPAPAFAQAAALRRHLQQAAGRELPVLSMGMSGDLEAAIAVGATMVRVGSSLFGELA